MNSSISPQGVAEAYPTPHFKERLQQRFGVETIPTFNFDWIKSAVDVLYRTTFPDGAIIGVLLFKSKTVFRAPTKAGENPSTGSEVWVVIDDDEMDTIMFRKQGTTPRVNYVVTIDDIKNIVQRKGDWEVTEKDLRNAGSTGAPSEKKKERGAGIKLPIVRIRNNSWFVDYPNETFIYVKNVSRRMTFDQAFEQLPEEEIESVLAQVS